MFNHYLKFCADTTRDAEIIDQFLSLVNNNGRIDHPKGGHDDGTVATLLTHWLLLNGKNLHIYGIEHSKVLLKAKVQASDESGGAAAELKKRKQLRVKEEINTLYNKLKTSYDPYVRQILRNRMLVLYGQLETEDIVALNLEELLKSIKEEKMFTSRAHVYRL